MSRFDLSIRGLEQAQFAMRTLFIATRPEGRLSQLVHMVTVGASVEASRISPRLSGTLASSHRERMVSPRVAEVYLDPSIQNIVYGGRPVVYGPIVHDLGPPRNWMERVVDEKGKFLVDRAYDIWSRENLP